MKFIITVLIGIGFFSYWKHTHHQSLLKSSAPAFPLPFKKGKKAIFFTAEWCTYCQKSKPFLENLSMPYYVVLFKDSSLPSGSFYDKAAGIIKDLDGKFSEKWLVSSIPALFIVDEHNKVIFEKHGLIEKPIVLT